MPQPRPPERISTVKFLRTKAEEAGGIRTTPGQALHRAAGHFIRLQEELERCRLVTQSILSSGDQGVDDQFLDAAAAGIYGVARLRAMIASDHSVVPPEWATLDAPAKEPYLLMARAAHGEPVVEYPATARI